MWNVEFAVDSRQKIDAFTFIAVIFASASELLFKESMLVVLLELHVELRLMLENQRADGGENGELRGIG